MSYFQGVVTEFLRADRSMFVNSECLIQLNPSDPVGKGAHWYCDAVAVNFREESVYLCEVTYSASLQALFGRLEAWSENWSAVCEALVRDCNVPSAFVIQPWVFIPESRHGVFERRKSSLPNLGASPGQMPAPRVTYLESVVPWQYPSWDRKLSALEGEPSPSSAESTVADASAHGRETG